MHARTQPRTGKLELDPTTVAKARGLAEKAGRPIVEMTRRHTTVAVERATLRLAGLSGADADGSGAIDSNAEHPATYSNVSTALANQNFLVIAGPQTCPGGSAVRIDGLGSDVFVNVATEQHQP